MAFTFIRSGTGELSGPSMIKQIELGFDDAANTSETIKEIALGADAKSDKALEEASEATKVADVALKTAQDAQASAGQAQNRADEAFNIATGGGQSADAAMARANQAYDLADTANATATGAATKADAATVAAEKATDASQTATSTANEALAQAGAAASSAGIAQAVSESAASDVVIMRSIVNQLSSAVDEFETDSRATNLDGLFNSLVKKYFTGTISSTVPTDAKTPFWFYNWRNDTFTKVLQFIQLSTKIYARSGVPTGVAPLDGADTYTILISTDGAAPSYIPVKITRASGAYTVEVPTGFTWTAGASTALGTSGTLSFGGLLPNGTVISSSGTPMGTVTGGAFVLTGTSILNANSRAFLTAGTTSTGAGTALTFAFDWTNVQGSGCTWGAWEVLGGVSPRNLTLSGDVTGAATFNNLGDCAVTTKVVSSPKLATPRTIALSGAVTGSTTFDGTANVTIAATASGALVQGATLTGDTTGTATVVDGVATIATTTAQATKLRTARNITLSGDVTGTASFDGTANATITATASGAIVKAATLTGDTTGTATVANGTATIVTTTSQAAKLKTARSITLAGGVTGTGTFDGSSNLTIDTVVVGQGEGAVKNVALTGDTTGTGVLGADGVVSVATTTSQATKLTTARDITLSGDVTGTASFDGTANAAITATVPRASSIVAGLAQVDGKTILADTSGVLSSQLRSFTIGNARAENEGKYYKILSFTTGSSFSSPDILLEISSGVPVQNLSTVNPQPGTLNRLFVQGRWEDSSLVVNADQSNAYWVFRAPNNSTKNWFLCYSGSTIEIWFQEYSPYQAYTATIITQTLGPTIYGNNIWTIEDGTIPYDSLPAGYTVKESVDLPNRVPAGDVAINYDPTDLASARGQIGQPPLVTATASIDFNNTAWLKEGEYSIYVPGALIPLAASTSHAPVDITSAAAVRLVTKQIQGDHRVVQTCYLTVSTTQVDIYSRMYFNNSPGFTDTGVFSPWEKVIDGNSVGSGLALTGGVLSAPVMKGATASVAGTVGLVPAPAAGSGTRLIDQTGTWKTPDALGLRALSGPVVGDTSYDNAVTQRVADGGSVSVMNTDTSSYCDLTFIGGSASLTLTILPAPACKLVTVRMTAKAAVAVTWPSTNLIWVGATTAAPTWGSAGAILVVNIWQVNGLNLASVVYNSES